MASRSSGAPPRIVLTTGEPAGIGPELVCRLAQQDHAAQIVAVADAGLMASCASALGLPLRIQAYSPGQAPEPHRAGTLVLQPIPLRAAVERGRAQPANAPYVADMLHWASQACLRREMDALVTAPVHKGVLNRAGMPFTGHTEFLADEAGCQVVMLLATPTLRVALATTHLPLRAVPDAIRTAPLERTLLTLHDGLRRQFGIGAPRIGVLGLNPHAGEDGVLGSEDAEVIAPLVKDLRLRGYDVSGPWSADTAFVPDRLRQVDAILAMYHDQGLPVLKASGFGQAVNVTLGLPYVRTSVDHGTALDIAAHLKADPSSLLAALQMAIQLSAGAPRA